MYYTPHITDLSTLELTIYFRIGCPSVSHSGIRRYIVHFYLKGGLKFDKMSLSGAQKTIMVFIQN